MSTVIPNKAAELEDHSPSQAAPKKVLKSTFFHKTD